MKMPGQALVHLIAAVSLPIVGNAQSLADVAKKGEEQRAKTKQSQPAPVFTNKDLVDVTGPPAGAVVETRAVPAKSPSDQISTQTSDADNANPNQTRRTSVSQCQEGSPAGVRVSRVPGSHVETKLSLVLRGRQREQLPVNLVLTATHDDWSRSEEPRALSLFFALSPTFAGGLDFTPPHVVFVVDEGRASADVVAATIDGPLAGVLSSVSIEQFSLADLTRLGRATTLRGRLFNLEFTLIPEQKCLIREFSQRVRQRPNGPGVPF